jgi:hypothetical protein
MNSRIFDSSNSFLISFSFFSFFFLFFILIIQDEVEVDTTIGIDQTTQAFLVGVEVALVATRILLPTITDSSSSTDAAEDSATISQTGMPLLSILQYIFDYLALRGEGSLLILFVRRDPVKSCQVLKRLYVVMQ